MRRVLFLASLIAAACVVGPTRADVKPHPLFTDGAVLQQGRKVPVWGTAEAGEKISVTLKQGDKTQEALTTADDKGHWITQLEKLTPGAPCTLTIAGKNSVELKNILVGEVWVCSGQSNMEWPLHKTTTGTEAIAKAENPNIRLFTVPKKVAIQPETGVNAKWLECTPQTVGNFSAVGYFFGRDLEKARKVPVGLIHTSWGGTPAQAWTSQPTLAANDQLKHYTDDKKLMAETNLNPHRPAGLFNGMVAPLQPYAIAGVIWYQGESNAGQAYEYRTLFPAMIEDWRQTWEKAAQLSEQKTDPEAGGFTFLCVQLAPFDPSWKTEDAPKESNWAELREAQVLATKKLKKVGIAVITDVGDAKDIHPQKKEPVGARLALAARAITYGEKVPYQGPTYEGLKIDGNKAVLSFTEVGGGLEAKDGALTGFTVAGEDRKFHKAEAEIQGDKVIVTCKDVEKPVAVRYGWANFPVVNLWNKDGLPASPFRTDDFPMITGPKK